MQLNNVSKMTIKKLELQGLNFTVSEKTQFHKYDYYGQPIGTSNYTVIFNTKEDYNLYKLIIKC